MNYNGEQAALSRESRVTTHEGIIPGKVVSDVPGSPFRGGKAVLRSRVNRDDQKNMVEESWKILYDGKNAARRRKADMRQKDHLKEELRAIQEELFEIRHDFHRHPELSGREERTAQRIRAELEKAGLSWRAVGGTPSCRADIRGRRCFCARTSTRCRSGRPAGARFRPRTTASCTPAGMISI